MTQAALSTTETGRRAFRAGLKPIDNPFAKGSKARRLWARGYTEARENAAADAIVRKALGERAAREATRDKNGWLP